MDEHGFIPLHFEEYPASEMRERAVAFYDAMRSRRTVRHFSERPVPMEVIEDCLRTAGTAPRPARGGPRRVRQTPPES